MENINIPFNQSMRKPKRRLSCFPKSRSDINLGSSGTTKSRKGTFVPAAGVCLASDTRTLEVVDLMILPTTAETLCPVVTAQPRFWWEPKNCKRKSRSFRYGYFLKRKYWPFSSAPNIDTLLVLYPFYGPQQFCGSEPSRFFSLYAPRCTVWYVQSLTKCSIY